MMSSGSLFSMSWIGEKQHFLSVPRLTDLHYSHYNRAFSLLAHAAPVISPAVPISRDGKNSGCH